MTTSWLFVPGDSEKKIHRALVSQAHAVIVDWEDGVAPGNKAAARRLSAPLLKELSNEDALRLYVRLNALDTADFIEDVRSLPLTSLDGVVLPKACGPHDIRRLKHCLEQHYPGNNLQLVAVATEDARSVLSLTDFREPVQGLHGLMWGAEDLAADMGVLGNRDSSGDYLGVFVMVQNLCVLAACATESIAIDAVCTNYKDPDLLARECRNAKALGFTAKAAIHPDQVPIINEIFQPSPDELSWARRVVKALDGQGGVAVVDGKMVDAPHLKLALRMLQHN